MKSQKNNSSNEDVKSLSCACSFHNFHSCLCHMIEIILVYVKGYLFQFTKYQCHLTVEIGSVLCLSFLFSFMARGVVCQYSSEPRTEEVLQNKFCLKFHIHCFEFDHG